MPVQATTLRQNGELSVPTIKQTFTPPDWTGLTYDSGDFDCVLASVTMILQSLQMRGIISGATIDYMSVRRKFREKALNANEGVSIGLVDQLTPTLTNNALTATVGVFDAEHWQEAVAQQIQAGYPIIATVLDWSLLKAKWKGHYVHSIVVYGLQENKVFYNDPWDGNKYTMDISEFSGAWGNKGLSASDQSYYAITFQKNQLSGALAATNTPTNTPSPTSTNTPTSTSTASPTSTPTPTRTSTSTPSNTPTSTSASVQGYFIKGHVTDGNNSPLTDVTISSVNITGDIQSTTKTNKKGDYAFTALAAGTYTITPSKPDYTFEPAPVSVTLPPNTVGPNFIGTSTSPPTETPTATVAVAPAPTDIVTPTIAPIVPPSTSGPGPVMAFYYPWYEPDDWTSGKMSDTANPTYSGGDDEAMKRHIQQADDAGIDALICAWYGPNEDRINKRCHRLLQLVEESGRHIRVAVFPDPASFVELYSPGKMAEALDVIRKELTSSPAYFKWQDKPVVFFYHPQSLGDVNSWKQLRDQTDPNRDQFWFGGTDDFNYLDSYDALFYFDISWENADGAAMGSYLRRLKTYNQTHNTNKPFIATVQPGYDDTLYRGQGHVVRDRANGDYYRGTWKMAITRRAAAVVLTSFNEFYEGSYIEPSQKFGDQYLQLTKDLITQYRHS
jgi:hypothetical protein